MDQTKEKARRSLRAFSKTSDQTCVGSARAVIIIVTADDVDRANRFQEDQESSDRTEDRDDQATAAGRAQAFSLAQRSASAVA